MIEPVVFDFDQHREAPARPEDVAERLRKPGAYAWIDILTEDPQREKDLLRSLGIADEVIEHLFETPQEGRFDIHDTGVHLTLSEALTGNDQLESAAISVVLGARCLVTFRSERLGVIDRMRHVYKDDFLKFSKSPGFLLYELADGLCSIYRQGLRTISSSVAAVQADLLGQKDEDCFARVSALLRGLLLFRKTVLAARDVLQELATRKSPYVSETTQPFLEITAGALDRLGDDLTVERDILNESLSLYMGLVGHRTNHIVKALTILSMIFMPLTFITGIYGMNLEIPEARWHYTYFIFWTVVACIVTGMLLFLRRRKWL
jgi:magnesium transporter